MAVFVLTLFVIENNQQKENFVRMYENYPHPLIKPEIVEVEE